MARRSAAAREEVEEGPRACGRRGIAAQRLPAALKAERARPSLSGLKFIVLDWGVKDASRFWAVVIDLKQDVLVLVMRFLHPRDILNLGQVCSSFFCSNSHIL